MRCPGCRTENLEEARYCLRCGLRLSLVCVHCEAENSRTAKFCAQCGSHLDARAAIESVIADGERKLVTVLFADIQGSLSLILGRDPEHASALLARVIDVMKGAVHDFGGTVNRILGDGIMALFGAPVAHEDHALRACYAALALRDDVVRISQDIKTQYGVDIKVRIGLNSGEVVVHTIRTDVSTDYDAAGEVVHLASRMEQTAEPGSIRCTDETLRLVRRYVTTKSLGPVAIKGLPDPIHVFELLAANTRRSRVQFGDDLDLTQFVDRATEMGLLGQAAQDAVRGHGRLVALVGEAGVGKSRLAYEFLAARQAEGWGAYEARAQSYSTGTAYLPIIKLLKGYFGLSDADNPQDVRDKIVRRLKLLGPAFEGALSAFLTLQDVPGEDQAWQRLAPAERRARILDAVRALFVQESAARPLVLLFEDLHWIDAETELCLDRLMDALPKAHILLLVTYRPEYAHAWTGRSFYAQYRLDPLSQSHATEILQALTGGEMAPIERLIIERAQGNPLFIEESVNALVDQKILVGTRGDYRFEKPAQAVQVPGTIRALLAARLDRLHPEAKRVLQAAAVIGRDVPLALLTAISERSEADVLRTLRQLQRSDFIYETRILPEAEYTFRHALIHEVSYQSMLLETRRALHARVAEAMELIFADRLVEHVERLAHHCLIAELWRKAALYCRQAGAKAAARSADREAVAFFEQALGAVDHLPLGKEKQELAVDIRFGLRTPLFRLGELRRELDNLREAEAFAVPLGDPTRLGLLFSYLSHIYWLIGEQDRALDSAARAATLGSPDSFALGLRAEFQRGLAYFALCDFPKAVAAMRHVVDHLDRPEVRGKYELDAAVGVVCLSYLARSFAETGDFAEARLAAERSLRLAKEVDKPFYFIAANLGMGYLLDCLGHHEEAIPWLRDALDLCRRFEANLLVPPAASLLGLARLHAGDRDAAVPLLREGAEAGPQMGLQFQQGFRLAALAEGYLELGNLDLATQCAERARDLAIAQREQGAEAYAARILGALEAAADARNGAAAERWYAAAAAKAEALGMRPLVAHCWRGRGLLQARTLPSDARRALQEAAALYDRLGLPLWAARAARDLAALPDQPAE
jgi:class 3 adenylate cyclase/tetratricopeptide (TPR) repeat protein